MKSSIGSSDEELVRAALAGEDGSFEEIYRQNRAAVFGFALRRLANEAEAADLTQEVFLQVYRGLGSFRCESSLLTWILGIAHFHVLRSYRNRDRSTRSRGAARDALQWVECSSPEDSLDARRILARCRRVLSEDPAPTAEQASREVQRRVFELHYGRNLSTREIARELGKSRQAIKISLFRTRQMLHERVEGLQEVLV